MNNEKDILLDEEFIKDVWSKLTYQGLENLGKNKDERKKIARDIIATIPAHFKNLFTAKNREHLDKYNASKIVLYKFFSQELKKPQDHSFSKNGHSEYKRFKNGTVGYYIGKYLYMLDIPYDIWMGVLTINIPSQNQGGNNYIYSRGSAPKINTP